MTMAVMRSTDFSCIRSRVRSVFRSKLGFSANRAVWYSIRLKKRQKSSARQLSSFSIYQFRFSYQWIHLQNNSQSICSALQWQEICSLLSGTIQVRDVYLCDSAGKTKRES